MWKVDGFQISTENQKHEGNKDLLGKENENMSDSKLIEETLNKN